MISRACQDILLSFFSSCSCFSSPPSLVGESRSPCAPWGCGSSWGRETSCPSLGSCSSCLPCSWTSTCWRSWILTSTSSSPLFGLLLLLSPLLLDLDLLALLDLDLDLLLPPPLLSLSSLPLLSSRLPPPYRSP